MMNNIQLASLLLFGRYGNDMDCALESVVKQSGFSRGRVPIVSLIRQYQ